MKASILVAVILGIAVIVLAILYMLQSRANHRKSENAQRLIAEDKRIQEGLYERLSVMSKISRGFLTADSEHAIIDMVLENVMNITGAAGVSFVPLDDRGQPTGAIRQGAFPFPLPDAWLEYLASPTIRQQCNECKNHGSIMTICPLLKGPFSQAAGLYCLPLRRGDQDLGILNLYLPNESVIGSETQDFLSSLVDETALALESVRLRHRELEAIGEMKASRRKGELENIFSDLLLGLQTAIGVDYVLLALKGYGIDWLSKKVRIDQLLSVGQELSKDELNLVGNIIQQVFTSSKDYQSGDTPVEPYSNKFGDMLIAVPLRVGEQNPIGVVAAGKRDRQIFHEDQKYVFRTMAAQIVLFVESTQGAKDIQYRAMIEERGRLAREIHDGLAQTLGFLKLQTAQMQSSLEKMDLERLSHLLKVSYSALTEAYQDAREAIDGLRLIGTRASDELPPQLDEAIRRLVSEYLDNDMLSSIEVDLQSSEEMIELAPEVNAQLVRIVQEALSNIRKHSAASRVWISTRTDHKDIVLEVRDNGRGFSAEDVPEISKHGLVGMRERAELIGADFQVVSRPGEGTAVVIRFPLLERKKMEM